jgi:hypothetical protein
MLNLKEKALDSRRKIGEAERSDIESYKGVRRIRKGQAKESSKDDGVSECERSMVTSHDVLQGGISNFTTREVKRGNLGDKRVPDLQFLVDLILATKLLAVGGRQLIQQTERVTKVWSDASPTGWAYAIAELKARGLWEEGEKEWSTNKMELLGFWALDVREDSEKESAEVGGGQHNFNHLVLEGARDATVRQLVKQMWV